MGWLLPLYGVRIRSFSVVSLTRSLFTNYESEMGPQTHDFRAAGRDYGSKRTCASHCVPSVIKAQKPLGHPPGTLPLVQGVWV